MDPHASTRQVLTRPYNAYTLIGMDATVDLAACIECHCLAARRRAREITRLFDEKLRPHGLRATQFSVLAAVAVKGAAPVGELAYLLGLDRTTLTRSANVLERNGWVDSDRSQDGRERLLRLTHSGRQQLEGAFPAWKDAQDLVDRDPDCVEERLP